LIKNEQFILSKISAQIHSYQQKRHCTTTVMWGHQKVPYTQQLYDDKSFPLLTHSALDGL